MEKHVCDHLREVEDHLVSLGVKVTFAGQAWSSNCRHWIYVDAALDCEALKKRFNLPACVQIDSNDDPRSGREKGLVCSADHDALMGRHPEDAKGVAPIS
jgi:hypothetical protein